MKNELQALEEQRIKEEQKKEIEAVEEIEVLEVDILSQLPTIEDEALDMSLEAETTSVFTVNGTEDELNKLETYIKFLSLKYERSDH